MNLIQKDNYRISTSDYLDNFTTLEKIKLPNGNLGIRFSKIHDKLVIIDVYDHSKVLGILKKKRCFV